MRTNCRRSNTLSGVMGSAVPPAKIVRRSAWLPSRASVESITPGSSAGSSRAAPAPSPNSTHVVRSVMSSTRDSTSAPITSTRSACPAPDHRRPDGEAVHEPGARRVEVERGTRHPQPRLDERRGGGQRPVGRAGRHDQQVDRLRRQPGARRAPGPRPAPTAWTWCPSGRRTAARGCPCAPRSSRWSSRPASRSTRWGRHDRAARIPRRRCACVGAPSPGRLALLGPSRAACPPRATRWAGRRRRVRRPGPGTRRPVPRWGFAPRPGWIPVRSPPPPGPWSPTRGRRGRSLGAGA